jgi:outer membrane protein OmpA-like peptidoglycan-associated protein
MSAYGPKPNRIARLLAGLALGALLAGFAGVSSAEAQAHRGFYGHGHGFYGRGFYGHGFYGRGFYGRGFFGPRFGFAGYWPGYYGWGWPYAYPYPYYVYPPTYVAAPAPRPPAAPPVAAAPVERQFTVYFDFDKYDLTREGAQVVDRAVGEAKRGGPASVEVVGNTDLAGTGRYNQILSERRAATVRDYMVAHGVPRDEIQIQALGKTDPAVQTADGTREPRNRRVEIIITPHGNGPNTSMNEPSGPYAPPARPSAMGIPSRDDAMRAAGAPRAHIAATPISAPPNQAPGQPTQLVAPQQ